MVSMGLLKWVSECMTEKNYAKVITESSPLQIVMLDEVCERCCSCVTNKINNFHKKLHHRNLFHATVLFQYPSKHQKTRGFLMFSGGAERSQWHEMV